MKKLNINEMNNLDAILTHDLKTPLTAQINVLHLLSCGYFGNLTSEQEEILKQVISSAKLVKEMVNSILNIIKYEDRADNLNFEDFRLRELIEEVLDNLKDIASYKENIIHLHTFKLSEDYLYADKCLIKKAVLNLLLNSINCTNEKGRIDIYLSDENHSIKFEILNTTAKTNVTREKLSRLFNRYALRDEKFRAIGTGLGLNMVKEIIEKHNGFVYCDVIKTYNENFDIYEFGFELNKTDKIINIPQIPLSFQKAL